MAVSAIRMRGWPALALALLAATPAAGASAAEVGQFRKVPNLDIRAGESRSGDLYALSNNITVDGVQDGDLFGFAQSISIGGEVTGDLVAWTATLNISGTIRDAVRAGAQTIVITGLIEGDLLAFGAVINLAPGSRVTGNMRAFGGEIVVDGDVDGNLTAAGGSLKLGGKVGGDAELKFDRIELRPGTRIAGDLQYASRNELDLSGSPIVTGEVVRKLQPKKETGPRAGTAARAVLGWVWRVALCVIVGSILLVAFRRWLARASGTVGEEALLGTLIGFGSAIVAPVAAVLAVVALVIVPLLLIGALTTGGVSGGALVAGGALSALAIGVLLALLYLAKIPVAIWLGGRLLGLAGRGGASPFLALALGAVPLYLLFEVPFGVGFLVWLVVAWLGLGATILAVRRGRAEGGAAARPALDAGIAGEPAP